MDRGRRAVARVHGLARPIAGGDRAADDRARLRRHRSIVLGGHVLSAHVDGGDAALRQDQRHSRPARHHAGGHRHFRAWRHRFGPGAQYHQPGPGARPARHRRRRHGGAGHDRSRRHRATQAAGEILHLLRHHLHDGRRRRPGHRRSVRRTSALVAGVLDFGADGHRRLRTDEFASTQAAALRKISPSRCRRRRADRRGELDLDAGDERRRQDMGLALVRDHWPRSRFGAAVAVVPSAPDTRPNR